jgi:hypothetical protein
MKKLLTALALTLATTALLAADGKSCDMNKKGETVSMTGIVACKSGDDCTFRTSDEKTTIAICEMSKADVTKLSASGQTVTVKGKLITCEGKQKLQIDSAK